MYYTHAFKAGSELRVRLLKWIGYYNAGRPQSALAGRTPDDAYGMGRGGETGGPTKTGTAARSSRGCKGCYRAFGLAPLTGFAALPALVGVAPPGVPVSKST